jgi:hypothetical protein
LFFSSAMETLLITMQRLDLEAPFNRSGELLSLTSLVLPRPGIQKKTALKPFRLTKGVANLSRKPFNENALLKEKVDGTFALTLQMTAPAAHSELQKWLRDMAAIGLESAGDLLAAGLETRALRPLLRAPFDQAAETLSDDPPDFILEGSAELHSDTIENAIKATAAATPHPALSRVRNENPPPKPTKKASPSVKPSFNSASRRDG